MYTEGPQCKRPRNQADSPAAADEAVQDAPITYDENYYREDGDAVIRVENVLFKIHRYLLVRDSSVFADMFNMPQGDSATIAATNESPIRLYD
ncbi:hypothetical protein BDN70DRAFT_876709 [Pholiota conissans]|uniref:BTB domain-containing protein n=1 Tax=Pholiota conissans TaxID=109636 RepID=A0A9P5Z415_9AGAR|nr:hypothetical protein BDN70DRAFT_876709 [Pholiota conissans]